MFNIKQLEEQLQQSRNLSQLKYNSLRSNSYHSNNNHQSQQNPLDKINSFVNNQQINSKIPYNLNSNNNQYCVFHVNELRTMICTNQYCTKKGLVCSKCFDDDHSNHKQMIYNINNYDNLLTKQIQDLLSKDNIQQQNKLEIINQQRNFYGILKKNLDHELDKFENNLLDSFVSLESQNPLDFLKSVCDQNNGDQDQKTFFINTFSLINILNNQNEIFTLDEKFNEQIELQKNENQQIQQCIEKFQFFIQSFDQLKSEIMNKICKQFIETKDLFNQDFD